MPSVCMARLLLLAKAAGAGAVPRAGRRPAPVRFGSALRIRVATPPPARLRAAAAGASASASAARNLPRGVVFVSSNAARRRAGRGPGGRVGVAMTGEPILRRLSAIEPEADDLRHPGATWRMLFSADRTASEGVTCGVAEIAAGRPLSLHRHAHPEVYVGLEGEALVSVEGREHPLGPGAALFIPGGAAHGVRVRAGVARLLFAFAADAITDVRYEFPDEDAIGAPPGDG
jgi:quercetin dioxygenase-like cupin family protein